MFQDIQYFFRQWRRPIVESKINRVGRNRSFRRQPGKQARIFFLIWEGIRRRPFHDSLEFPVLFNLDRTARCRNTDLPEPDDRQYGKKQDNDKDRCIQMPEKTDASPVGFVHRDNLCKSDWQDSVRSGQKTCETYPGIPSSPSPTMTDLIFNIFMT